MAFARNINPPSKSDHYNYENVGKVLDMQSNYQTFLLTEDFNTEISDHHQETFPYQRELKSLSKKKTCFKVILNSSFIDLFLTNNVFSF